MRPKIIKVFQFSIILWSSLTWPWQSEWYPWDGDTSNSGVIWQRKAWLKSYRVWVWLDIEIPTALGTIFIWSLNRKPFLKLTKVTSVNRIINKVHITKLEKFSSITTSHATQRSSRNKKWRDFLKSRGWARLILLESSTRSSAAWTFQRGRPIWQLFHARTPRQNCVNMNYGPFHIDLATARDANQKCTYRAKVDCVSGT